MELVNSTIVDVAIKKCITEDSILGVVTRRIAGKVNWKNIKSLESLALMKFH